MIGRSIFPFILIAGASTAAWSQTIKPIEPGERVVEFETDPRPEHARELSQAVIDRLSAEYLNEDGRADLRVLHGQWTPGDLLDPELAPRIALDIGDWANPIFEEETTPEIVRAWSELHQGNAAAALIIVESIETPTLESEFVRASAIELLGQRDEAIRILESIETTLTQTQLNDASDLAIGCEALIKLTRLRSPAVSAKADYEAIKELISYARDRVDRLDWRLRVIEAELLYEHHNLGDAHAAAVEALRLNPRAIRPMMLIGQIAVDGFDFDTAERIADGIDALSSAFLVGEDAPDAPRISDGGAILRARVALRRKDPEDAERALDPALARFPDHPMLRALEASAAAGAYRMSSTNRLLDRYNEQFPGSPAAALWVGRTLSESRQYRYAAEVLRRAIDLAPNWGEPRLHLGLMLVQAGKDSEARLALTDALKLDPFNLRAQNSLTLLTELATYQTIETEHFIIRYKEGPDEILAREMPEILEAIHTRVCSDLPGGMNSEPKEKTIIELMPNHEWFAVRIGGMPSIHTMAASTGPVIAFESPRDGPKSKVGTYDWARVLQHEYTHTANLARTRNRVIHWMTEANAVYNEDSPRDQQQWTLLLNAFTNGELFDLESINIAFVRPEKPSDRSLAYAQGAWMFQYLIDAFGPTSPRDIMDASTTGRSASEAFEMTLDQSPDQFMDGFLAWARDDLRAHGLLADEDQPGLDELLDDPMNGLPSPELLDELAEQYPDHAELVNLRLGISLMGAGDELSEDQIRMLEHAIKLRPTDEMPHKRLARFYLSSDSIDEHAKAIGHLEFLDVREVNSPVYADQLAELYAQTGQPERALIKAIRATRIAPFDPHAREQVARMALLNEDYEQARYQIGVLTVLEPDRPIHQRRLDALSTRMDN